MATAYFDKLRIIYDNELKQGVVEQTALASPLFDRLMAKSEGAGGSGIDVSVKFAYNYNLGDTHSLGQRPYRRPTGPARDQADFFPHTQQVGYSSLDKDRNVGTKINVAAINYFKNELETARNTLEYYMGVSIFSDGTAFSMPETGNTFTPVEGLRKICSTSNTLHGISQTTYPWWQSKAVLTATTDYTDFLTSSNANNVKRKLQDLKRLTSWNKVGPDMIVTTKIVRQALKTMLGSNERFSWMVNTKGVEMNEAEQGAAYGHVNYSWNYIDFEGVPVLEDEICPAGYIFALTTKFLKIGYNRNRWFDLSEFEKKGDGYIADLNVDWALVCESPRHIGQVSGCPTETAS